MSVGSFSEASLGHHNVDLSPVLLARVEAFLEAEGAVKFEESDGAGADNKRITSTCGVADRWIKGHLPHLAQDDHMQRSHAD